jgi:SNF2 family DNA or RNA helicase
MRSRPKELYNQIEMICPNLFSHFNEFGYRYCAGKMVRQTHYFYRSIQTNFGLDFSGSSNMEELRAILSVFMIRRIKSSVLSLPPKVRQKVLIAAKPVSVPSKLNFRLTESEDDRPRKL